MVKGGCRVDANVSTSHWVLECGCCLPIPHLFRCLCYERRNQGAGPVQGDWLIENHLRWMATQSCIEIWMSFVPLWLSLMTEFDGSAKSQRSGCYDGIDIECSEMVLQPGSRQLVRWFVCLFNELGSCFYQFIMFSLTACLSSTSCALCDFMHLHDLLLNT